ncbi:uncharacterized protein PV09_07242 [Verruconis gallopava]|uniref:Wax synthase domain-containing protein n=1 Tax=Verruconis gallopava TaxID=253628 RepID=A0A0D2A330_9PEZI|nr:uncharacterized protein PV09_07242 [Verruconis gallopava]KIW01193.1 hypothetical protein PV09_07242 [Verruconis gallopava]
MSSHSSIHHLNPSFYFATQGLLTAATVLLTNKKSPSRLIPLVLVLALGILELRTAADNAGPNGGAVATFAFLYTAQLANLLCVTSVSLLDFTAFQSNARKLSPGQKIRLVLHLVAFNFRGIRTPWQIKNVPPFSDYFPGRLPRSRITFMGRQILIMAFQYLIADLVTARMSTLTGRQRDHLFGPGTEFAYFSATRQQWYFRIVSSIVIRWCLQRAFLSFFYNLSSIAGVATSLFSIEDFPPFMGSVWSSYTLRGYWGQHWHQTLRWPLTSLSTFITRDILDLPKPSLLERYTHIFLVFSMSGFLHVFIDIGDGKSEFLSTMLYFQSFALGIMMEDGVQALWRWYTGQPFIENDDAVHVWKKIVGFMWVNFFFVMVEPWYCYPAARLPQRDRKNLPVGVSSYIGEGFTYVLTCALGLILLTVFKVEV